MGKFDTKIHYIIEITAFGGPKSTGEHFVYGEELNYQNHKWVNQVIVLLTQ